MTYDIETLGSKTEKNVMEYAIPQWTCLSLTVADTYTHIHIYLYIIYIYCDQVEMVWSCSMACCT